MKTIQGIALVMVLIFLQILAILGLYAMQIAWLLTKQSQYVVRQQILKNKAEKALRTAEIHLNQVHPLCIIPVTSTAELLKHSMNWWQSTLSCAGNFQTFQYYYVVELLGIDPCAIIQAYPKNRVAEYFRITLLGVEAGTKVILQSTWVKEASESSEQKCEKRTHYVTSDRQMWRNMDVIYKNET